MDHGTPFNATTWLVDRHVDEGRGDRVALRCQRRSTTYTQLGATIRRSQAMLTQLGVRAGDRVAMVVPDDETFPAVFLGAMRGAMVPVPLSTMLRGPELGAIVADSGAATLVLSASYADRIDDIVARAPKLTNVVVSNPGSNPASAIDSPTSSRIGLWYDHNFDQPIPEDLPAAATTAGTDAFWLYSSGTTGVPKGVMHVHGNIPATVQTYAQQVLHVGETDRCLSVAKLFFAYGLGNSLTFPLAAGATAVLDPNPPTPAAMAQLIVEERATLFFASPGFCAAMLDSGVDATVFDSVRATVTAGESLPANVQTRFAALSQGPVLDGIGSTELLHIFISNTLDEQSPGSSGRLVPGYTAELRDDDDQVIDRPDTPGYLHVRGPSSATGYWQQPDVSAEAFRDGWVRTGDVYLRSETDHWTFLGRNNDMIKAGGIWVSPAEVESVLIEHESVLEAAVVGGRDDQGLETVVAFIVPASGATIDIGVLDAHCRDRMAPFKRPRSILAVDEFPKTATGKIKRFELRDGLRP